MPRPKPTKASRGFPAGRHSLSDAAKEKLTALLPGADPAEFIPAAEFALGIYIHGQPHLDHIPRPQHYLMAFKPVARDSTRMLETLKGWSDWFRHQFESRGVDLGEIERHLSLLKAVSEDVLKGSAGKSSKGARSNTALAETIRHLRRVFRDSCRGPLPTRSRKGSFQFLADWEKRELDFVRAALCDAHIIRGEGRELPRLFRDPRCQPPVRGPAERHTEMERIAEKVSRRYERKKAVTSYPKLREEPQLRVEPRPQVKRMIETDLREQKRNVN